MTVFIPSKPRQRPVAFRTENEASDTIPEPELAHAVSIVRAFDRFAITLPASEATTQEKVTARYGDDELDALRETLTANRARRRASAPASAPASLIVRRSFGRPLPRTDEE